MLSVHTHTETRPMPDKKKLAAAGLAAFALFGGLTAWSYATTGDFPFANIVRARLAAPAQVPAVDAPAPVAADPAAPTPVAAPTPEGAPPVAGASEPVPDAAALNGMTTEQLQALAAKMAAANPQPLALPLGMSAGLVADLVPTSSTPANAKAYLDAVRTQKPVARVLAQAFDFTPEYYFQSVRSAWTGTGAIVLSGYLNVPEGKGGDWGVGAAISLPGGDGLVKMGLYPSSAQAPTGFHIVAGALTDATTRKDTSLFFDAAADDLLTNPQAVVRKGGLVALTPGQHPIHLVLSYGLACNSFAPPEPCKSPAAIARLMNGTTVQILLREPGQTELRTATATDLIHETAALPQ